MFFEVPAIIWLLLGLIVMLIGLLAIGLLRAASGPDWQAAQEDYENHEEAKRAGILRHEEFMYGEADKVEA